MSMLIVVVIPNCTSGKDVYILATDTLNKGSGAHKPGAVCAIVLY